MIARFVEVTDQMAYGKFLVCRLDADELQTRTAMPEAQDSVWRSGFPTVLNYAGRRRFNDHSTLVVDLQRGVAAAWPLHGGAPGMQHYLDSHLKGLDRLVCPMYLTFVEWLHEQQRWAMGAGNLLEIPRYLELPFEARS